MLLGLYVLAADMPEINRLWATIDAWRNAIEVLIVTPTTALVFCSPAPPEARHARRFQRRSITLKCEEPTNVVPKSIPRL
jgi:hypothetical protein